MKTKTTIMFYILILSLGMVSGYLYYKYGRTVDMSNLDCHSSFSFYNQGETEEESARFVGNYSIRLAKDTGLVQLLGKISIEGKVYNVFRKIEVDYKVIDENQIRLTTRKVLHFPRYDELPEKYEKQYLFRLYYEEGAELDYVVTDPSQRDTMIKISLIPRFVCTKLD